jgi:hypothetical protein
MSGYAACFVGVFSSFLEPGFQSAKVIIDPPLGPEIIIGAISAKASNSKKS